MEGIDGVTYNKQKEDPSKWIAFNAANTYMNQIDSVNKRLVSSTSMLYGILTFQFRMTSLLNSNIKQQRRLEC